MKGLSLKNGIIEKFLMSYNRNTVYDAYSTIKSNGHCGLVSHTSLKCEESKVVICMPFYKGKDLFYHIRNKERLTEVEARCIFREVLHALLHLHGLGFAHLDLSPENIMITDEGIKIIDYEFCAKLSLDQNDNDFQMVRVGKKNDFFQPYMSPEVYENRDPVSKVVSCNSKQLKDFDMYALGCILFVMVQGNTMFRTPSRRDHSFNIFRQKGIRNLLAQRKEKHISKDLEDLLNKMLAEDPKKRLSPEEILKHPWVLPSCPLVLILKNQDLHKKTLE